MLPLRPGRLRHVPADIVGQSGFVVRRVGGQLRHVLQWRCDVVRRQRPGTAARGGPGLRLHLLLLRRGCFGRLWLVPPRRDCRSGHMVREHRGTMPVLQRNSVRSRPSADARGAQSDTRAHACAHACTYGRSDACARDLGPHACAHACANGRPDHGTDPGSDPGSDPGTDPGTDPGADHSSTNPGADHGGADLGSGSGPEPLGRVLLLHVVGRLCGQMRQLPRELLDQGGRMVRWDGG